MTIDRLRRIHAVTDNFFFWQGLRFVPLGAAMVGVAILQSLADPLPKWPRALVSISFIVAALWISDKVIGPYYRRTLGRVEMDPERHVMRTAIKWMIAYPGLLAAIIIDMRWHPSVIVSGIAFAFAIEAYRSSTGGGRLHYVVAALGLGVLAVLPMWDIVSAGLPGVRLIIGVLGGIYMAGGVLDHRELLRVLGSDSEVGSVSAV